MANELSSTRLFLGNLPLKVTKEELEEHFRNHGKITDVKVVSGFGFVEFSDPTDAKDVVPAFHGTEFQGRRLTVQFARDLHPSERSAKGPGHGSDQRTTNGLQRTSFRMKVFGLPENTSWQDLKDFARQSGFEIAFTEVSKSGDTGIVEFQSAPDLRAAIAELNNRTFRECVVTCCRDVGRRSPTESRLSERTIPSPYEMSYRTVSEDCRSMTSDKYGYRSRSPPVRGRYAVDPYQTYEQHYPYYRGFIPADSHRYRSRSPDYAPREYEYRPLLRNYSRRSSPSSSSYNSYDRVYRRVSPDPHYAHCPPHRSRAPSRRSFNGIPPYYRPDRGIPPPPSPGAPAYKGDDADFVDARFDNRRFSRRRLYRPDDRYAYERGDDYWMR